jgi:hypothetical protein
MKNAGNDQWSASCYGSAMQHLLISILQPLLPRFQNIPHIPQLLLNQVDMRLTPRRELDLVWQRSTNHLLLIRVQIDRNLLSRLLINRMLHSERPKKSCNLAPLRALGELDPCADAAARAVIVVITILKVLGSGIVPSEVGVVDIAIWIEGTSVFVLGMVEGPVGNDDGCVFGLELRVSCCVVKFRCGRWSYDLQ